MAIEVRCGCGQMVYAEERFAGQHVQCPHCKAAVAVPVAPAAATPPQPEPRVRSFWDTGDGRMIYTIVGFMLLTAGVAYVRGCQEDAKNSRPSMGEIMQKARDKNR